MTLSHASHTHYCFSCLPHIVKQQGASDLLHYRFAYTRPSSAPELSKETIWHAMSRFQQYLKDGQTEFGHCLELSGNPTENLQLWRTDMSRKAAHAGMDGRPLVLRETQWNPVIYFDCTMYETPSTFERSPGADKIRTEVWRLHQIQAPWSPAVVSFIPLLQPLVTGIPSFHFSSGFYAAHWDIETYRDSLRAATADSRGMREHLRGCNNSCAHEEMAVSCLAHDWLGQRLGGEPDGSRMTLQLGMPLTAYLNLATAVVVFNLKNTMPQLNGLTYDVYTSRNTYDAGRIWMDLSVDKPPGWTGQ